MTTTKRGSLLVVDDEVELMKALCETLADEGFKVSGATSAQEGLQRLQSEAFDVLLSDLMMPGMDGIQLLRQALEYDPQLVGIIMTGQGTVQTAVEAMKLGAFDYVLKPFKLQTMLPVLARAVELRSLRMENVRLRRLVQQLSFESPRYQLVGASAAMQKVVQLVEKVAPTDATVLIQGASGTGKELVARALHRNSARADRPMVTINCAALQESLLESELFGYEKGAFTGAVQTKPGLVEVAEGGTLFIDEVAEMAPSLQAKVLRILEDGNYRRVGGTKELHANVRLIAATNKPLDNEQRAGRFREDLFYRLNVITIELPLLRERREDIPALVEHLLTTRQLGLVRVRVSPEAMQALIRYSWPGNIRELANVLERAQILAEANEITLDELPDVFEMPPFAAPAADEASSLDLFQSERRCLVESLCQAKGNKALAAKALGVSRRTIYRLIERHGLEPSAPAVERPV